MDLGKDQTYTSIWRWWCSIRYNIIETICSNCLGIWGAIANKMEASQETYFWANITQPSLKSIKRYVPKTKATIQSYLNNLKAYVEKLERNYIDIWAAGGDSPQEPATFQRIR